MSPGLMACPLGRFSVAPTTATSFDGEPETRDRRDGLEHGGAAGHVELHLGHFRPGLQRDAAAVERDRLAHEAEHGRPARRRPAARSAVVISAGSCVGALRDRREAPIPRAAIARGPRPRPTARRSPARGPRVTRERGRREVVPGRFCRSRAPFTASATSAASARLSPAPRRRPPSRAPRRSASPGPWAGRRASTSLSCG